MLGPQRVSDCFERERPLPLFDLMEKMEVYPLLSNCMCADG